MAQRPTQVQDIAQVTLNTSMLDAHMNTMAIPTLWEKSYLCPCRNRQTRQPSMSCPVCKGRGIAYLPPQEVKITLQSQDKSVSNSDLGLIDAGTAIGTPDRQTRISFRDRITVTPAKISQSFIIDATEDREQHGFFMVYDVHEVEYATTIDRELVEDEDFTIDYNKNRFFPKEHIRGENVSFNVLTTLRYMVADLLKEHRYAPVENGGYKQTPQKILLKREDLFVDTEAFSLGVDNDSVGKMVDSKRDSSVDGLNGFFRGGM